MARLTPRFSACRAVHDYAEQHFLPAAPAYPLRIADKGMSGRKMVDWQYSLEQRWARWRPPASSILGDSSERETVTSRGNDHRNPELKEGFRVEQQARKQQMDLN